MMAVVVVIVVSLVFPKDIQSYSVAKKWLIGLSAGTVFVILIFGFFILSAFLYGGEVGN